MSTARRLLLGLLVAAVFFAALELTARELETRLPRAERPEEQDPTLLPGNLALHPLMGWVPRPGQPGDDAQYHEWVAQWRQPRVDGPTVSPEGMRDDPLDVPRPDDQRVVLALGDSSVWGWGVAYPDTLPVQLEVALNAGSLAAAERPVEVLNTGVPGYSSFQSLLRLQSLLDEGVRPEGLFTYWGNSDMPAPPLGTPDAAFYGDDATLVGASLIYRLATGRLMRRALKPAPSATDTRARVPPSLLRQNLRRLAAIADDIGAWVVVVVPPLPADLTGASAQWRVGDGRDVALHDALVAHEASGQAYDHRHFRTALALEARSLGFGLVDGPAALVAGQVAEPERYVDGDVLFVDPVHPSGHGHRMLAAALLPELCARFSAPLPPGCPAPRPAPCSPPTPSTGSPSCSAGSTS